MKDQIEKQPLNSCGVRGISKNLEISKDTVTAELRKTPAEINLYFIKYLNNPFLPGSDVEIRTDAEADELRSYVGNKGAQRRTWYAVERGIGIILAWHNRRRTDESCPRLINKASVFTIKFYYTNDWKSYMPVLKNLLFIKENCMDASVLSENL